MFRVAIIRLSGELAFEGGGAYAIQFAGPRLASVKKFSKKQVRFDEGLVIRFPSPASFTGEDVVSSCSRGSLPLMRSLLAAFDGLRLAELTRRAFENGKLN